MWGKSSVLQWGARCTASYLYIHSLSLNRLLTFVYIWGSSGISIGFLVLRLLLFVKIWPQVPTNMWLPRVSLVNHVCWCCDVTLAHSRPSKLHATKEVGPTVCWIFCHCDGLCGNWSGLFQVVFVTVTNGEISTNNRQRWKLDTKQC